MPRRKKLPHPRVPPEELEERIEAYTKASTLKDPAVARELARSIVIAECHRDALHRELEEKGELSDDKHRAFNSLHSNLQRMRRAAGVLELRVDDELGADAGAGLSAAPAELDGHLNGALS